MRSVKYFLEFIALAAASFFFRLLDIDKASELGGRIGKTIGPKLPVSRVALRNLAAALPEITEERRKEIIFGMWENLGRVFGEYPHMERIGRERVEIRGLEIMEALIGSPNGSIIFGAHLANWEMTSHALEKLRPSAVVRVPNNPWIRRMVEKRRGGVLIPKSASGARSLVRHLKEGRHAGILIDQKYNEGIEAPFFGMPAMTSPAFVQLARKFSCPVVPVRFERTGGANFRITFYEPLKLKGPDGNPLADEECIAAAHAMLEEWIKERPEQWIWLHRRWKGIQ